MIQKNYIKLDSIGAELSSHEKVIQKWRSETHLQNPREIDKEEQF